MSVLDVCVHPVREPTRLLFTGDSDTDVCIPSELRNPTLYRDSEGLMGGGVCVSGSVPA